jgi:hypothetical protein
MAALAWKSPVNGKALVSLRPESAFRSISHRPSIRSICRAALGADHHCEFVTKFAPSVVVL